MKKSRLITLLLALVLVLSVSAIPVSAAKDDVIVLNFTSAATAKNDKGECGFFGPYIGSKNMADLTTADGLVFDLSVSKSWAKFEISPQTATMKKYVIFKIKTDNAASAKGFNVTVGGSTVAWEDLKTSDGKAAPTLTSSYQTVCIDVKESFGVSAIVAKGKADVAVEQGAATGGKLYINSITFTDEATAEAPTTKATTTEPKTKETTTKATEKTTEKKTTTEAEKTTAEKETTKATETKTNAPADVDTGISDVTVPAMMVAGVALAVLAVSKKKSK